jgi:hypothetical protein
MSPNWLGVAAAFLMTVMVAELLRRGILRERFAVLWLAVSGALLLLALVPDLLDAVADLLGFAVPSNLLFFASILFLLLIALQLSHEVSRLESRTRRLAEDLAMLSDEVRGRTAGDARPDRAEDWRARDGG